jgi:hypothetical protein
LKRSRRQKTAGKIFTIAVFPDTQNEINHRPAMFQAQISWIRKNIKKQKIAMVLHEGDVVQNPSSDLQWQIARQGFARLDGKVPFTIAAGNHEMIDYQGPTYREPRYPNPFSLNYYNSFITNLNYYSFANSYQAQEYRNSYNFFKAGGVPFMVLNLEFGAPDNVLAWAGEVVDRNPARHVILLTHDYLGPDSKLRGQSGDADLPSQVNPALNDGIDIWNKLVSKHPNIQFTLNGHTLPQVDKGVQAWTAARLVKRNQAREKVFQMLANYQSYNLGGGYLRLVKFATDKNKVSVKTYSPYYHHFLRDDQNEFTFRHVKLDRRLNH